MSQNGIVKILRRENPASIGRPADPQLVEEIRRDFHQPCLNQHLVGHGIQLFDQLQDLREEVDVGGDQKPVAALVGDGTDPAHEITNRPGCAPAVRCSRAVRLTPEPGIVAFFLGFLLQIEATPGRAARQLLLLRNRAWLARLRHGPQGRRAVPGKQDIDAVGHGRGLGKFKADPQSRFARFRRPVQLLDDILQRRQTFLGVGSNDQRVRIRLAGNAHLAVKPTHVAVGRGLGRIIGIEVIPVRPLRLFLQEEFVENVFHVHGADVL